MGLDPRASGGACWISRHHPQIACINSRYRSGRSGNREGISGSTAAPRTPFENVRQVQMSTQGTPSLGSGAVANLGRSAPGTGISREIMTSIRTHFHFTASKPRPIPLITERQKQKHLDFCRSAPAGPINWPAQGAISDESRFGVCDDMVCGAIGWDSRSNLTIPDVADIVNNASASN
jgi:hypothetical protein